MCQDPLQSHFCLFGVVADFLMSLFEKGLALATLRSYRSALASCHRGFCDGSSVTNSPFLTRLMRSFFFIKETSFEDASPRLEFASLSQGPGCCSF